MRSRQAAGNRYPNPTAVRGRRDAIQSPLEQAGLEVYLVNARDTKNLPGRKSDVQESQWLMKLHTYGLLRNSFRPSQVVGEVRDHRKRVPTAWPQWLVIPERSLFNGIAILGEIGSADLQACDRDISYTSERARSSE
jgi:hypothetical protein